MMQVHKYREILLEEFYLGDDDITIYRAKDGYKNRFKKGDKAKYHTDAKGYLKIQIPKARASIKVVHLLCLLRGLDLPDNFLVDHLDGDVTNDTRDNLRITDVRTNACNRVKRSDNTSGITGIRWSNYHNHYVIRKTVKGKRISRSRKTLGEAKLVLQELTDMDSTYTVRHGK